MRRVAAGPAVALALVAAEALAHVAGVRSAPLALCVVVLAPGLALLGLLPAAVRAHPLAALAAVPALGLAASSVLLVSASRLGVPIDGEWARALVAAACAAGFALPDDGVRPTRRLRELRWEAAGLAAALALGALLQSRVLGDTPVPGNDWGKYVLYADEIRRQGAVLIDNPLWQLGVPFRDDPGAPAVFGAALAMSGAPAAALAQGIWALAVAGILAVFALVRCTWGPLAGGLAAALYAVVPANHDILAWHGLANVAALALLALALAYVIALLRGGAPPGGGGLRLPQLAGFALVLVALAATHRLTTLLAAVALALAVAIALAGMDSARRRATARALGLTAACAAGLGAAVLSDLLVRQRGSGGTQGYEAYEATKVALKPALLDLTIPFSVAAGLALLALAVRGPRDGRLVPVACLLGVTVAMAYAWVAELPLAYLRMVYYLPLALVVLVAVWLGGWRRPRAGLAVGLALVTAVAALGWGQARRVHEFYEFADPAALRGLDWVAQRLRPDEVVVTDRCWSFLATWLLHTRTLPALETHDIGPAAELPLARQARDILSGRPAALERARELGVRYVVVNPTCVDLGSRAVAAPLVGRAVYVSRRLTVLELG